MAFEVVATETFAAELDGIFAYCLQDGRSIKAAKEIKRQLDDAVRLLSGFPELAAISRKPLLHEQGLREWFFGSYALIYRLEPGVIYLERLFHQRQDYERLV